jgi:hypothetical protein
MAMTNVYTGANGALTLANEDTPEGQDAGRVMTTYDLRTVGRVTGVEIYVQTDLEAFYELGRRHAVSLHPGKIAISGKVSRAYINGAMLFLLLGRGASPSNIDELANPYAQPAMNMTVTLSDPAFPGTTVTLELQHVKFQNWSYGLPDDDFVAENLSFKALAIRVLDRQAPEGGGEATALVPEGFTGGDAVA